MTNAHLISHCLWHITLPRLPLQLLLLTAFIVSQLLCSFRRYFDYSRQFSHCADEWVLLFLYRGHFLTQRPTRQGLGHDPGDVSRPLWF